jgi:DHA2 family multidrug resistance protein
MAEPVRHRALITGCAMMAVMMNVLDSTIANVALPYMQGSLSTTLDQVTWVLTSYVIASAILTAPVGWLAVRFGRKNLFIACIVGFTITSMMCGAAQTLGQMVLFRILQGAFGAALVPLSQATMLDIYPLEQRAQAMAIFGIGVMVGPILGPTLGGYLTDAYNWRWVFYVNLPFGILATFGLAMFMPAAPVNPGLRFDWTGFVVLAVGIGSLQLMLDRGQEQDWFTAREIVIEAVLAALGIYLFVVHMFTAEKPFLPRALFFDRNYIGGVVMMFLTGMVLLASSALLAPYLQNLGGYEVAEAGLLMAPRGGGTMVAMLLSARMANRVDQRKLIAIGLILLGATLYDMGNWTPDVSPHRLIVTLMVQGFALGWIFNPMTVLSYSTLAAHLRSDGAALQSLMRNIGAAIGISVTAFTLARNIQVSHADLAAGIDPFNRLLSGHGHLARLLDPMTRHGAGLLDAMINREATIIAYSNDFRLMSYVVLPSLLLLPLLRRARSGGAAPARR